MLVIAIAGIAATLLAYALSAGVRHAVGHAEHSVKHAVGHVFDRDEGAHARAKHPARPASRGKATQPGRSTAPPQGHTKAEGG